MYCRCLTPVAIAHSVASGCARRHGRSDGERENGEQGRAGARVASRATRTTRRRPRRQVAGWDSAKLCSAARSPACDSAKPGRGGGQSMAVGLVVRTGCRCDRLSTAGRRRVCVHTCCCIITLIFNRSLCTWPCKTFCIPTPQRTIAQAPLSQLLVGAQIMVLHSKKPPQTRQRNKGGYHMCPPPT